jgi:hypothetical protein
LQGWAVRAGEAILRGTFICEYIGEVLDENEANKRRGRFKFCSEIQLLVYFTLVFTLYFEWSLVYQV